MPRQRRQVSRYGKQDEPVRMSDLESSGSDDDDNRGSGKGSGGRKGRKGDALGEEATDENPEEDENQPKLKYTRNECYNVEKCILVFGYAARPICSADGHVNLFNKNLSFLGHKDCLQNND